MGWRKDLKKTFKSKEKNIYDYLDAESTVIIWDRVGEPINSWTLEFVREMSKDYVDKLNDEVPFDLFPSSLKSFNYVFNKLGTSEFFTKYLSYSDFDNIYTIIKNQFDNYTASLCILMINKFNYFSISKFWNVFKANFLGQKQYEEKTFLKLFEAMKLTNLEIIEKLVMKFIVSAESVVKLDFYRHHLLIEEMIDLGEEQIWHWTKMLDQFVDATIEGIYDQEQIEGFDETFAQETNDFENQTFEDFFEKTKTVVYNDELDEAFDYFGVKRNITIPEFRKIYRVFAKKYHPDLNPDANAANEMKKVNIYKEIIENYLEQFN